MNFFILLFMNIITTSTYCMFLALLNACTFSYSCELPSTVPLYLENVSLLKVNGKKLSSWSKGAFLNEGENRLELSPCNKQTSSNSYLMDINVEKYKEYKLKADNTLRRVCLWEQSPTTKLIISKKPIICINF